MCAISMCLSYPHTAQHLGILDLSNTAWASFLIAVLAVCQFFNVVNNSPLVLWFAGIFLAISKQGMPRDLHL